MDEYIGECQLDPAEVRHQQRQRTSTIDPETKRKHRLAAGRFLVFPIVTSLNVRFLAAAVR